MDPNRKQHATDPTTTLVEELARAIFTFARHRPGRLAAVSVRVPLDAEDIRAALSSRLHAFGIADAVVHVQHRKGEAAVVSVEYER